ncbi:MAG: nuclear transport factor 2 family protein [Cyanobacteria bacterium P01_A01_bin.135]
MLGLGGALGWGSAAQAQTPAPLVDFVQQLDAAANGENLSQVMQAYSEEIIHSDGLSHSDIEEALSQFWEQYDNLRYSTDITRWEQMGSGYTTETETRITGTRALGSQSLRLTATLTAQQEIVDGQIVSQTILDEVSRVTTGDSPPTLEVNLPEQVDIGQQFYFDAIVMEPLEERLLLGSAMEESVSAASYGTPSVAEFDLLSSGGLFKVGRAPAMPGQQWLSAVIIRDDGITGITRRLQVTAVE